MAIDRAATLKNAEKLLRQGKLDLAIAEYLRIVEEDPRDWNTANLLGDLYVRARKVDKAVDQFTRIADSLSDEGFLPKAGALYKKILKVKPDDEHALLQGAEIATSQGLLADARACFNTLLDRRRARGDDRGVAQIYIRLGSLDPEDLEARLQAAKARLQVKDAPGALRDFKELAVEFTAKGRQADAIDALREAAAVDADDPEIRERLLDVYLASGDFVRARECASTVEELRALAGRLEALGQPEEALSALRDAAKLDPSNTELRAYLARTFVERGDMTAAAEYLTVETAGDDPKLLFMVAEIHLRGGRVEEGMQVVTRLLAEDPARRQDVAMLGWAVAEQEPEAGFQVVEAAANAAVAEADWPSAAAALQEFVTRVPSHIQALMHLVDICVDGGLEATMYSAQAHLADAYIAAGMASEARFLAEDLVAREPWDRANVERFRRSLVLMGESDPDAVIAERLSGESPFISTDLSLASDELAEFARPAEPAPEPPVKSDDDDTPSGSAAPSSGSGAAAPSAAASSHFELSSNAVDLGNILGEMEAPPVAHGSSESVEVDLSIVLNDIKPEKSQDLDEVFSGLRDDASRKGALAAAQAEYKKGLALHEAGKIDECVAPLEAASRAPRLRFPTASLLGQIARDKGNIPQAIEWFERAAEAPAPSPAEGQQLLYELASSLESVGEVARALAIFMELQAEAGEYLDVSEHVDRLSKAQA